MICPKCGEDNSDNFRFCGMCGNLLEARRPAGAPVPNLPQIANARIADARIADKPITNTPEPPRPAISENATLPANKQVPPISAPSMLGLDEPATNQPSPSQLGPSQLSSSQPSPSYFSPSQSSPNQPSMDALREKAFSGLDSFFEPEQPKTGRRRILLLLALLAALGVAGWWTYSFLGAAESGKSDAGIRSAVNKSARGTPDAAPVGSSQVPVPPAAAVPKELSENANASPAAPPTNADSEAKPNSTPVIPRESQRDTRREKVAENREPRVASKAARLPERTAADTGDADFRKGEASLYGRGVPENCDEAVKYLKAASAKSNAKARSAFGTMYATGHCVPRDLPTSYSWFALALRLDPNNQILEKDLSAIWNQMTPPERQLATRMKQ